MLEERNETGPQISICDLLMRGAGIPQVVVTLAMRMCRMVVACLKGKLRCYEASALTV